MRLLYFAPSSYGGLADYARFQARALSRSGIEIDLLCGPDFTSAPDCGCRRLERLRPADRAARASRLGRAWRFMSAALDQYHTLAATVRDNRHTHVLIAAYAEYFAPLWAGSLRRLARAGTTFGAVVHDPVRDAALGPAWWHRRSVAGAYSFLTHAFVHEAITLDTAGAAPGLRTTVIPHGPYLLETTEPPAAEARARYGLPAEVPVVLAFGHLRDNKNLHLTIEAMRHLPDLHLLVAGKELSGAQKPAAHYRELARNLGVDARCRWEVRFIAEAEIGALFAAADLLALTYDASFRSASGVLNAALQFRKPCLASSGAGPLRGAVEQYALGLWVPPDDAAAVLDGYRRLLAGGLRPRWDDYARDHSWERNAALVAGAMFARSQAHAA